MNSGPARGTPQTLKGHEEPHAELAWAKFRIMPTLSIGARFGICAEARAEKFIWAMAARSALAEAEADAAADAWAAADICAAADAMAEADRLTEASAPSGASIAEICALALAPAVRLMPVVCRVPNEARNAARDGSIPGEKFNAICKLAMAFNEPAIALMPA